MTSDITTIDVLALATVPNGAAPNSATLDQFYAVLADGRRRRLLDHLASVGETTFDDLVDAFAGEFPERERLANLLYHVHLPKLVAAGIVDSRDGVVTYDPPAGFDHLYEFVDANANVERATHGADEGFDLLADYRRREVLALVDEHHEITLPDVADEVAIEEFQTSIVEIPPDDVLDVYLSLYHDHVPRLEAADLVEYDQERDLVALSAEGASHAASAVDE
ncbi:helix-turn-helix domain-containing protein [Halomarina rubra]|uniref:Helix-turn-helix domain-containing protein n=1 Tax=Halomarina rubra TaxID=2071873 RepID=A0ABD6B156_9EURY|nr:helix-turn-helix domain-containing protein [Halomarina rubra]